MDKQSRYSYAETVSKLSSAITASGNTIFLALDQAKAAQGVGLTMRPTTLIIFGNPKGGTPLMVADPEFALELPLKILVWEEDGKVFVTYPKMSEVAQRYKVASDPHIAGMDHALDSLTESIV
jgi:uncharacterized protein (DUF302 family)